MCEDKDIPVWKLNVAIMQGGRQDLRLSLPLPKIENPNDAKQSLVQNHPTGVWHMFGSIQPRTKGYRPE